MASAKVVVFHPYLGFGGGAEALALALIDTLAAAGARIDVVTAEAPSSRADVLRGFSPALAQALDVGRVFCPETRAARHLARAAGFWQGPPPVLLAYALLLREWRGTDRVAAADLVISTFGECDLAEGARQVCYIHHPILSRNPPEAARLGGRLARQRLARRAYTALARRLAGYQDLPAAALLLTNSRWSAGEIRARYHGTRAEVLAPPILPFPMPPPFAEVGPRAFHVVSLGRLVAYKGHAGVIRALAGACAQSGQPAHLTIFGRGDPAALRRLAPPPEVGLTVEVCANASAEDIGATLSRADLGVSGFAYEHFGMAVAEMQASGLPVLVPESGGQAEIVPDRRFLYASEADLAARLLHAMAHPDELAAWRQALAPHRARFSREAFDRGLLTHITAQLARVRGAGHDGGQT